MKTAPWLLMAFLAASACAGAGRENTPAAAERLHIVKGPPPAGDQHYAGAEVCAGCHAERFRRWAASDHAASMETLRIKGEEGNPSCLRCHATGFGSPTGHGGTRRTGGLSAVACEACHGPSGEHAASRFPALVRTPGAGDCRSCEVVRICRECHTPRHSPLFDLQLYIHATACFEAGTEEVSAR